VWDQPFRFLHGANQNACLLWKCPAIADQIGDGRTTPEDLDLIEKGEMLPKKPLVTDVSTEYEGLLSSIAELLQRGRQHAAKSVNAVLTATYWSIGRRLVEYEQGGKGRAAYGSELLKRLSRDLQSRLGRGFSERNLEQMRQFYLHWQTPQTVSANSEAGNSRKIPQTPPAKLSLGDAPVFPHFRGHTKCGCFPSPI